MKILGAICLVLICAVPALAAGPTVDVKGILCWVPIADLSLTGYRIAYQAVSGQPPSASTIDAGLVTTAPTPPPGVAPCATGKVGVLRDNSSLANGQYYAEVAGYNVKGVAVYSEAPFLLAGQLPPATTGVEVH